MPVNAQGPAVPGSQGRLVAVDLARSAALLGMAIYHFSFDLQMFGHLPSGTVTSGGWGIFARLVAGSFLVIAGFSLVLAHRRGFRGRAFLRRLAVIGVAAAGVSLATWLIFPREFIFFGILHSIFVASLIGAPFLFAPVVVTLAVALAIFWLPFSVRFPALDGGAWQWLGLSEARATLDFEPVFPWAALFLVGIAAARIAGMAGWLDRARRKATPAVHMLAWPGRHSLAVYLIHQPALLGLVAAADWLFG